MKSAEAEGAGVRGRDEAAACSSFFKHLLCQGNRFWQGEWWRNGLARGTFQSDASHLQAESMWETTSGVQLWPVQPCRAGPPCLAVPLAACSQGSAWRGERGAQREGPV